MRLPALLSLLSCLFLCLPARAPAQSTSSAAVPPWVVQVAVPSPAPGAAGDTESLLSDQQVRVESDHSASFVHRAYAVLSPAGVQSSSELSIERASEDVITWHFVRRTRAGVTVELLPTLQVKVIQPESRLDDGIYDGAKREFVFLEDVRVGDVIEFAYSLRQSTAILGNRYADGFWLGRSYPLQKLELRVSWPETRTIAVRAFGATVERPSPHALKFTRTNVPSYRSESREPAWFHATPRVELSEFKSWAEVVDWALPHYAVPVPPEVEAKAASFRAGTPAERMALAVRFVQDEVRYLGLEEGVRALVPHPASQVLARRFGDCKDKAVLLVLLLRALGFEADPALVSVHRERAIEHMLPSTGAFDHVVVRTKLDQRELWFDATGSYERGPITAPHDMPYGRALVLRAGERELTKLEVTVPGEPSVVVHERFVLSGEGSATLHVETTYRGDRANSMRARMAHGQKSELEKEYLDFYGKRYGELKLRSPLEVADDERQNRLVISEHYTLREFWKNDEQYVRAWSMSEFVPMPEASREERPFALAHPVNARHVIELYSTGGWETERRVLNIDSKAFTYKFSSGAMGHSEIVQHDFVSKADHVPVADLAEYVREATRVEASLESSYITGQKHVDEDSKQLGYGMLWLLGIGFSMWGLWAGVRKFRRAARRRRLQNKRRFSPGEAPESAIPVSDLAKARLALQGVSCCDRPLFVHSELEPTQVRYGDGHLTVYKRACDSCARVQARYFSVKKGPALAKNVS